METKAYPPLTAYRVICADGTSYVTNMAAEVTLEQARAYFVGKYFVEEDFETGKETRTPIIVDVQD